MGQSTPNDSARLGLHMGLGAIAGLTYTLVDAYLDRQVGLAVSMPGNPLDVLHSLIDLVLPTLTGALLAMAAHMSRLRTQMATLEKARAENLEGQIRKIERDQAVWVVAASLLHELKNPLHALGLLLDEALELPPSERTEQEALLRRARAQSEKISAQLGLLRGLPRAQSPQLPAVELGEILARTVDGHEASAHRQGVEFSLSPEMPRARANREYLEVILDNMVENALDALREQGPGGHIEMRARIENGQVKLLLADSGAGVPKEAEAHLFEPLWSSKSQGLGLGLATSRALARAMGGDITHRREPERTIFELTLLGET